MQERPQLKSGAAEPPAATEEELVQQSLAGDATALEQLLLRYYDRLLSYIRQQLPAAVGGRVGAEDILQHAYLKAFRAISSFEPRSGYSFFSWLKRIADNERIDQLRKSSREGLSASSTPAAHEGESSIIDMAAQIAGDDPTATVVARRRELIAVLHVTLAGMKPQHRRVIEMFHLEGRSLEEVAAELGMTTGQVRGLLHRARSALRAAICRLSNFV